MSVRRRKRNPFQRLRPRDVVLRARSWNCEQNSRRRARVAAAIVVCSMTSAARAGHMHHAVFLPLHPEYRLMIPSSWKVHYKTWGHAYFYLSPVGDRKRYNSRLQRFRAIPQRWYKSDSPGKAMSTLAFRVDLDAPRSDLRMEPTLINGF